MGFTGLLLHTALFLGQSCACVSDPAHTENVMKIYVELGRNGGRVRVAGRFLDG